MGRGENWNIQRKKWTNNELKPHVASTMGLEPGLHWWEAGSFNAGPSLSPQYAVNPLSTPPPLIPLLGKNVNKPLPSPPPFLFFTTKLRNDRLYWLNTTVMLRVDWSGMAYSHAGSADFFFFFTVLFFYLWLHDLPTLCTWSFSLSILVIYEDLIPSSLLNYHPPTPTPLLLKRAWNK